MALIQFKYGPRCGEQQHCSRETADALIVGGFAELVEKALDPIEQVRLGHPKEGWSIVRMGDDGLKIRIRHDDGHGGYEFFNGLAPSVRRWVPDSTLPEGGSYQMRPVIEIPEFVLRAWREAGGTAESVDPLAESDRRTAAADERKRRQFAAVAEQKRQDSLAQGFVLAHTTPKK